MSETKSVLFVCLGNICRSPTGEGILLHLAQQQDLESRLLIDSAGTSGYHVGQPADLRMTECASRRGYRLLSRSRQLTHGDLHEFDLVIAMDRSNQEAIAAINSEPTATVCLLSDFLEGDWPVDVPDPYYGGADGFEEVVDMIEAACPKILAQLLE
ncbi:MAG: low molecular weight phosphotyrosine protein phosphatase [Mariniblastus sp.]|nr:low molecular weight phosphotyrosine protein phosphatase [Mariniblastus sp.]